MSKKILLVEDEEILAEMYQEKLTQSGFEVVLAGDAEEGFDLAKREKPDLVILDILLPKGDGISFLENLRNDSETAKISVVALSNYSGGEIKERAFKLGVLDYLLKTDYTPQELIDKIKTFIR